MAYWVEKCLQINSDINSDINRVENQNFSRIIQYLNKTPIRWKCIYRYFIAFSFVIEKECKTYFDRNTLIIFRLFLFCYFN